MNVQVLSDQVLLNHYLSGDRSAISKLIERHSRRVKDYIHMWSRTVMWPMTFSRRRLSKPSV